MVPVLVRAGLARYHHWRRHMRKLWIVTGFALLTGLVIGCGSGRGELSGKVTYKGKPVPGGTIKLTVNGADTISALSTDGSYEFYDLPPGQAVLTIDNENMNPDKKRPAYMSSKGATPA